MRLSRLGPVLSMLGWAGTIVAQVPPAPSAPPTNAAPPAKAAPSAKAAPPAKSAPEPSAPARPAPAKPPAAQSEPGAKQKPASARTEPSGAAAPGAARTEPSGAAATGEVPPTPPVAESPPGPPVVVSPPAPPVAESPPSPPVAESPPPVPAVPPAAPVPTPPPVPRAPEAETKGEDAGKGAAQDTDGGSQGSGKESPAWERAHVPLTLELKLGLSWRPQGDSGFDDEDTLGSELGASLYWELKREIAAGLELERTGLGKGTALSGLNSVNADYRVTSAMLGVRAYPKRSELLDLFVGFQVGAGLQHVSATGTASSGTLEPAASYQCSGADTPAFQIGGGVGARLMLTPRWGVTARVGGTARRLTQEVLDACARGLGSTTSVGASLGLGYDFDLEP